jgi:membrane-associated protease RseP (regulator of RpoE activity)
MSFGNGNGRAPAEILQAETPRAYIPPRLYVPPGNQRRSLAIALILFAVTIVTTLAAGAEFGTAYAQDKAPAFDSFFGAYVGAYHNPRLLLAGLPFAATLLGILLAHELGHFFTCRHYKISASFPYFLPFPTLIGTMGAFIRIRSPIMNRKSLFDVGLSGPVVGFAIAIPALAFGIAHSKIVPNAYADAPFTFGVPLAMRLLLALLRPGVAVGDLLLHPVGRAAWVGLFVTSLNLLPGGQLDGGHILYSLASSAHKRATQIVALALLPLAYFWPTWALWAILILAIGFRHPPVMNLREPLDAKRRVWATGGVAIFILSFMPVPFILPENMWKLLWNSLFGH